MAIMFNPAAVDSLQQTAVQLVEQIGNYAAQAEQDRDEHDTGLTRQIRVIVASLNGAVEQLNRLGRMPLSLSPSPVEPLSAPAGVTPPQR